MHRLILHKACIETVRGQIIALASDKALCFLAFALQPNIDERCKRIAHTLQAKLVEGRSNIIEQVEQELHQYFAGLRTTFTTPVAFIGSSFQQRAWHALQQVPYGATCSYAHLAARLNNPNGARAVARAMSTNNIAILLPCHRVIGASGKLTGYNGGLEQKAWLLAHEQTR